MSRRPSPASFASLAPLALVVAALSGGCATSHGVNIVTLQPAVALEPRGADRLVLVDGEGRRSGKEEVADTFRDVARGGFFHVDDRGDEGIKLVLAGKTATIEGSTTAPRSDELYVRIDVLAWDAAPVVITHKADDGVTDVSEPGIHGRADLQVTVADASGRVLIREKEYRGVADVIDDGRTFPEAVIVEAARGALAGFLAEITPTRASDYLRFDAGDPGQKSILAATNQDTLKETEKKLRRYLKKNENNAIAWYNVGVALDGQGRFEEAIEAYDTAMKIVTRDGYVQARGGANARLAAWERVYGERPAKKTKQAKAESSSTTETTPPTGTSPPAPAAPPAL